MPKGPRGEKRPADAIGAAIMVGRIATGDTSEKILTPEEEGKSANAVTRGKSGGLKGGKARAAKLSATQRAEISRIAATARWKKSR